MNAILSRLQQCLNVVFLVCSRSTIACLFPRSCASSPLPRSSSHAIGIFNFGGPAVLQNEVRQKASSLLQSSFHVRRLTKVIPTASRETRCPSGRPRTSTTRASRSSSRPRPRRLRGERRRTLQVGRLDLPRHVLCVSGLVPSPNPEAQSSSSLWTATWKMSTPSTTRNMRTRSAASTCSTTATAKCPRWWPRSTRMRSRS